jgi:hypothetical protein
MSQLRRENLLTFRKNLVFYPKNGILSKSDYFKNSYKTWERGANLFPEIDSLYTQSKISLAPLPRFS